MMGRRIESGSGEDALQRYHGRPIAFARNAFNGSIDVHAFRNSSMNPPPVTWRSFRRTLATQSFLRMSLMYGFAGSYPGGIRFRDSPSRFRRPLRTFFQSSGRLTIASRIFVAVGGAGCQTPDITWLSPGSRWA